MTHCVVGAHSRQTAGPDFVQEQRAHLVVSLGVVVVVLRVVIVAVIWALPDSGGAKRGGVA